VKSGKLGHLERDKIIMQVSAFPIIFKHWIEPSASIAPLKRVMWLWLVSHHSPPLIFWIRLAGEFPICPQMQMHVWCTSEFFHIWMRLEIDLRISESMCFFPAYIFMPSWIVPHGRKKKIRIGPLENCNVNAVYIKIIIVLK